MSRDQTHRLEFEHFTRKGRKRNTLFNNYIHEFAGQLATTESYMTEKNGSSSSSQSQSQHVWLMIVDRLRKDVLNARDCHRADTLARSQLFTPPPPAPPPPSHECSVCKKNKAIAKTVCTHFLCWECLCEWHKKGSLKKLCPCCHTILSRSQIVFMDEKPEDGDNNDRSRIDEFPIGLIPFGRSAETEPVWAETISTPPLDFDEVNAFLPMATDHPTWSTSQIAKPLESWSSPPFLDDVWPEIELHGEIIGAAGLYCNTSSAVESSSSSTKMLNSADFEPSQSDLLSTNIRAASTVEPIQMQGQELEEYPSNSNIVAESWEAGCSLNERDLDSLLDEQICDWSLLEEMFAL